MASAKAMERLLHNHPVFGEYKIILAAGDGRHNIDVTNDDTSEEEMQNIRENEKAYDRVKDAIRKYDKTITLSVGQLTTGVTIEEWSAVLMLSDIKSESLYMQAIFRSQNPHKFIDENGIFYRKRSAYVFDFSPSRVLKVYDKFEIIIPKLYGSEVKKEVATRATGQRHQWDEVEFMEQIGALDLASRQAVTKLVNWSKNNADSISYGTGVVTGSMNPRFKHVSSRSFFHIMTTGEVLITYDYLEPNLESMKKLRDILAKHISFRKITDIPYEKLSRSEVSMPSNYVSKNVDQIIAAFNEFIRKGDNV